MAQLLMLACILPLAFGADYGGGVSGADGIVVPSVGTLTPPGNSFSFGQTFAPVRFNPDGVVVTGFGTMFGGAQPFSGINSGFSGLPSSPFSGFASGFPGRFGPDSGFTGLNAGLSGLATGPNFGFNGLESGLPGPQSAFAGGFRLNSGLDSAFAGPPGPSGLTDFRQINFNGPNSGYGPLNSAFIGRTADFPGFTMNSAFAPDPFFASFAPLGPMPNNGVPAPFGVRSPFAVNSAPAAPAPTNPATSTVNYVGRSNV